jgi:hypothetical protein
MRKLAAAVSLAFVVSLGACADTPTAAPLAAAVGTYTLKTVDGTALPFAYLEAPGWKDEIISGTVELRADGRFRDQSVYRRTRDGAATEHTITLSGIWSPRDNLIRFLPMGEVGSGRPYAMRLEGTRLILVEVGLTSVFER